MNEVSSVSSEAEVPGQQTTAGQMLRQAREDAGLHIAVLAGMLKVPVPKLEALETDDFSVYNDLVFMRGLASSACRVLKIDSSAVLQAMPSGVTTPLYNANARMREVRFESSELGSARRSNLGWLRGPRGIAIGVLLAGAALVALWPVIQEQRSASSDTEEAVLALPSVDLAPAEMQTIATTSEVNVATANLTATIPVTPLASASAPVGTAVSDVSAALSAAEKEAVAAAVAPTEEGQASESLASPVEGTSQNIANLSTAGGTELLRLRAKADSWVQVRSATGDVVTQRLLKAGEDMNVQHTGPLSVTVGRADSTEVYVRGEARDIISSARDNVARFEVK